MSTLRLRPLIAAGMLTGTVLLAACGGGGSSGGGGGGVPPGPTPTPTPVPTATPTAPPTPTPCPTANRNPATEPVILGCSNGFPTVNLPGGGTAGGSITFPLGSTPGGGVVITVATAATQPPGYPSTIPPPAPGGSPNPGAGATAIAPWLTFSLSQAITAPDNPGILLNPFNSGPMPAGVTYVGIYDLTQSRTTPVATFCRVTPALGVLGASRRGQAAIHYSKRGNRVRPNVTIPANDANYFGLFFIQQVGPSDSNDPIDPSGKSPFTIPPLGKPSTGFSGVIGYPANNAPAGSMMSLESINDNNISFLNLCVAPAPAVGTPILYLGLQTAVSPLDFKPGTERMTIQSSTLVNGSAYSLFAYDVLPSGSATPISQQTVTAQSGAVTFQSPLNGLSFQNQNGDVIVFELTKN